MAISSIFTRDAERVLVLAEMLGLATHRLEIEHWRGLLSVALTRMLKQGDDAQLGRVLDRLYEKNSLGYGPLADLTEELAETARIETPQGRGDLLLLALPVLVWSRYTIPSGTMTSEVQKGLYQQVARVLASNITFSLCDQLLMSEQLPSSYSAAYTLIQRFAKDFQEARAVTVEPPLLSLTQINHAYDIRYVLGALCVAPGQLIWSWQTASDPVAARAESLSSWNNAVQPVLAPMMTGCRCECVHPDVLHAALREADRQGRLFSLQASVSYLGAVLELMPEHLDATIGAFGEEAGLDEYRIGFARNHRIEVLHGVIWPVLTDEEEGSDTLKMIESLLRAAGISTIRRLNRHFPTEGCDDCGAVLFPAADGAIHHVELPPEAEVGSSGGATLLH